MKIQTVLALLVAGLALAGCKGESTAQHLPAKPAEKVIADGTLMTPGTPQLTPLDASVNVKDRILPLEWNMWWGENGRQWSVYVDGIEVRSGKLPIKSPQSQQGKVEIELDRPGTHEVKVALCNDHGCTESKPMEVSVLSQS